MRGSARGTAHALLVTRHVLASVLSGYYPHIYVETPDLAMHPATVIQVCKKWSHE